jgi:hypothetical protein
VRVSLALVFAPFFSHYFRQFLIVLRYVSGLDMAILDPAAVGASKTNMIALLPCRFSDPQVAKPKSGDPTPQEKGTSEQARGEQSERGGFWNWRRAKKVGTHKAFRKTGPVFAGNGIKKVVSTLII